MSDTSVSPFTWSGRRDRDPAHDRVVEFLVMDIQRSPDAAQELMNHVNAAISGSHPQWERLGNVFHLVVSLEGAAIEDCVDEAAPIYRIPLEEFQQAVSAWMHHVDPRPPSSLTPTFISSTTAFPWCQIRATCQRHLPVKTISTGCRDRGSGNCLQSDNDFRLWSRPISGGRIVRRLPGYPRSRSHFPDTRVSHRFSWPIPGSSIVLSVSLFLGCRLHWKGKALLAAR